MKRKLILITVIMSMSMSSLVFANDKPAPVSTDIKVNGTDIGVDYVRLTQGTDEETYYEIMVPLKPVAESLGYEVYDATYGYFDEPSYESVILIKDDTAISVKEGSNYYIVNHEVIYLDGYSPATIIDGEMYVTSDFFYEVLGYETMGLDKGELVINTIPEEGKQTEEITSNEAPATNTEKPENVNSNGIDIDGVSTEKTYTKTETGETLIPLKIVSEELGYSVVENENGTIDISDETMKVSCQIGSKDYTLNGEVVTFDTAPIEIDGEVYAPIEILDLFGYGYDGYSTGINIVTITPEEMTAENEDYAKLNKLGYYYLDGDKIVKFQLY